MIGLYELLGNPTTYLIEPHGPNDHQRKGNKLHNTTEKTYDWTMRTPELVCYNIIVGKMSDGVRLFAIAFDVGAMFDFEDLSELSLGFQS